MPKEFLAKKEIRDLVTAIQDLVVFQKSLREAKPISARIQFPKIPPILSESIAFHLIRNGILHVGHGSPRSSKSRGDIEMVSRNGRIRRIEVKATAKSAFQELNDKDLDADYLIWMYFGEMFYETNCPTLALYVVKSPKRIYEKRQKITLKRFRESAKSRLIELQIDLNKYLTGRSGTSPKRNTSVSTRDQKNRTSQEYKKLHKQGLSIKEIVEHCGRTSATIRDLLHGRGGLSTPIGRCLICRPKRDAGSQLNAITSGEVSN